MPSVPDWLTRLLRRPQQLWLRRAIFQVHLWSGLAMGLYVAVLSITGSLLVYRAEADRWLATPRAVLNDRAMPLTGAQLREAGARAYPGWTVASVYEGAYQSRPPRAGARRPPDPTASLVFERGGEKKERLFDPYSGTDLGDAVTQGQWALLWVVSLHDELLFDPRVGLPLNGWLSLVFTAVVLTGAVVWWPGVSRWKRSLAIQMDAGWRRTNWDVHSALGFWLLPFLVMWGISGWYLGLPDQLMGIVEALSDPNITPGDRRGDVFLEWLARLHFGRWRDPAYGPWLKALWAAVGLVPALMFVTGVVMWWNRVVRRRRVWVTSIEQELPAAID
jgi:uncharacterized iron-regulated membrane protein